VTEDELEKIKVDPAYVVGQLVKALLGKGKNAPERTRQWYQVLTGMAQGILQIGSRAPVSGSPPWITLEVVHGGFATGGFAAGGILKPYEIAKLNELQKLGLAKESEIKSLDKSAARAVLNIYFAGAEGRKELSKMLKTGHYRTHIPEEAALLIATWLIEKGEADRTAQLLEVLAPFFDRLRFYPEPAGEPLRVTGEDIVYLQTAGICARQLRDKSQQKQVAKMNESIKVWTPLYDRAASLFFETVEGENPQLLKDHITGQLVRAENGQPVVSGGWPCKKFQADWAGRASQLLIEYEQVRHLHGLCKKHEKPKENFARLRKYLVIASKDPAQLSGINVGDIRRILASYVTAHGAPGSKRLEATRSMQESIANRPLHKDLARVMADRLDREPADQGVADLTRLWAPLSAREAFDAGASEDTMFPASIVGKTLTCGEAPLITMIEQKLIGSSEAMASVLPMLTANTRAANIKDTDLARLFASVYRAFRKRRSLLLLNLQSQVRFEELPWVSAVLPWMDSHQDTQNVPRAALSKAAWLAISAFPYSVLPNKLIREFRTLAKDAGLKIPLVDELAADIFTGSFSANFLDAAQDAAKLLHGTSYQRYFGIDYDRILSLDDIEEKSHKKVSPGFGRICAEMAEGQKKLTVSSSVVYNGAMIEQAQIVTTHNLASLWQSLQLQDELSTELSTMAQCCYKWICRRQQLKLPQWQTELKSIKNSAYAWRQMLFYISLADENEQKNFIGWADDHFQKQSDEFKQRFAPAMLGLQAIVNGQEFDYKGELQSGGKRFTGWSGKPHFLSRQPECK